MLAANTSTHHQINSYLHHLVIYTHHSLCDNPNIFCIITRLHFHRGLNDLTSSNANSSSNHLNPMLPPPGMHPSLLTRHHCCSVATIMILSTLLVLPAECHQFRFHCLHLRALPVLLYKLAELIEPYRSLATPPWRFLYWYYCRTNYCGIGVLMYDRTGYCLPLLHLCHQHVSICPDVNVRTLMLHKRDSKLNANLRVTLSKCDDAYKFGRT
jgi:hypothetical protein